MTQRAQKSSSTRTVAFRMPLDIYTEFSATAESRGVDMSGLLNWICAEYRPALLKEKGEWDTRMLEAAKASLRENLASAGDSRKALGTLRDLLKQMQDLYAQLSKRALDEDARMAG